ncbi:MAG: multiheme c-type cytochrome [Planctomycetota bacterium]|jgi:hypothetical protein
MRELGLVRLLGACAALAAGAAAQECVECHKKATPGIVADWQVSEHAKHDVDCEACHGDGHSKATDTAGARIPTAATCGECHEERVAQFSRGKHALAWAAMKAMPTAHWQPMALMEGMKGCGGCHKIGLKTETEIRELKAKGQGFGVASCDACHTRHTFSAKEARQPEACRTCHMGFDHAQWEMYSASKHGVRHQLRREGVLHEKSSAPTCQTCHMPDGDHGVGTAWGFLAVRLPLPEDKQWAADQVTILKALGVLDPEGKPTARLEVVKKASVARLTQEDWQQARDRMLKVCGDCHTSRFAKGELAKGDEMIRQADKLMAEAIRIVAALYQDGILPRPKEYAFAYPDLLTFHDAPTSIETRLFVMYLKHRMRAFQGAFHNNPDYALWYGWSELQRDLTDIREMARELRARKP